MEQSAGAGGLGCTEVGKVLYRIWKASGRISPEQTDRLLAPRKERSGKCRCGLRPDTLIKQQIPIQPDNWDLTRPGHLEAETVAHYGNSLESALTGSVASPWS